MISAIVVAPLAPTGSRSARSVRDQRGLEGTVSHEDLWVLGAAVGHGVRLELASEQKGNGISLAYFVPNKRSPASPSPGRMYPWASSFSSIAAVKIGTSGCTS